MLVLSVACVEDKTPNRPNDTPLTFDIEVVTTTLDGVGFNITPSRDDADYLYVIYDRAEVDAFTDDSYLVEELYTLLQVDAGDRGYTFDEYMAETMRRGDALNLQEEGLALGTEYYILVFGVDVRNEYIPTTKVFKMLFTTRSIPMVECDFDVTTHVEYNGVEFTVVPTDLDVTWHLIVTTKSIYDNNVNNPEGAMLSKDYFYMEYMREEIASMQSSQMTVEQIKSALLLKGSQRLESSGLKPLTDYVYLIAGLQVDGDNLHLVTDITVGAFTTDNVKQSDMTFEISVGKVDTMSVAFSIIPSNNRELYCALVGPYDGHSTADEMMYGLIEQWGDWMSVMANDRGPVEYTENKMFSLPAADMEYYIIAFGYNGGATTRAEMKTFRTLPGGSPEDVVFEVTSSAVKTYGFTLNIKSSDPTIYYVSGVCEKRVYNESEFVAMEEDNVQYLLEESRKFNRSITLAEIMDQYYNNGDVSFTASGLNPDTEVMAYIFVFDIHTGKVVRCLTYDAVARTKALGSVTPTVELVGHYSGNDEAGSIWGDAAATKDKSISVYRYTGIEDARSLYTTMLEGEDYTNLHKYPDAEVWSLATGLWHVCKKSEPYTFYVTDWNKSHTAMAYAVDGDGLVGGIGRYFSTATAENKGDIEELRALYDEITNAAQASFAMPESLVISEKAVSGIATLVSVE